MLNIITSLNTEELFKLSFKTPYCCPDNFYYSNFYELIYNIFNKYFEYNTASVWVKKDLYRDKYNFLDRSNFMFNVRGANLEKEFRFLDCTMPKGIGINDKCMLRNYLDEENIILFNNLIEEINKNKIF